MVRACGIALLWAMGVASDGYAETLKTGWQAETQLYLTGMINYQKKDDSSVTYDTVATTVELKFSSDTRPYYASLFVDYQFSSDNRFDDNVNLGAYIKYSLQNWDATSRRCRSNNSQLRLLSPMGGISHRIDSRNAPLNPPGLQRLLWRVADSF